MRALLSNAALYGKSRRLAESMVADASATKCLRPVSTRYMMMNMATVDFASSRDHESTSYHSSLDIIRCIAATWNGANSYFA